MVWQEVFPFDVSNIDADEERELRLASQARLGAEWAFAALVARYQPPVTRYLNRLTGNPDLSRAIAERVFVRMERRLRGPVGGLHLRLWLLRSCTDAGLDALRQPRHMLRRLQLDHQRPAGLLTSASQAQVGTRLRKGLDAISSITGTTRRQLRGLIWSAATPDVPDVDAHERSHEATANWRDHLRGTMSEPPPADPIEVVRYRMIRAVLAELPWGDAQCLALHLVAGLNQQEVARALGITPSATRHRIVHGLQLFSQRFEANAASLGLHTDMLVPGAESAAMPHIDTYATQPPVLTSTRVTIPPAMAASAAMTEEDTEPVSADAGGIHAAAPVIVDAEPPDSATDETASQVDITFDALAADMGPGQGSANGPMVVDSTATALPGEDAVPLASPALQARIVPLLSAPALVADPPAVHVAPVVPIRTVPVLTQPDETLAAVMPAPLPRLVPVLSPRARLGGGLPSRHAMAGPEPVLARGDESAPTSDHRRSRLRRRHRSGGPTQRG